MRALEARVPQHEIAGVYDKLAGVYDIWGTLTESKARRRAIELAQVEDGQTIVEVAVGTGLAFSELVRRNRHGQNTGFDLSAGMLAKARKRLAGLSGAYYSLRQGTAFALPVQTGSVDLLVNNYMFDLIPSQDTGRILDEFARVLKQDGRLVLVNMTQGETMPSRLYELVYRVSPKAMGGCRGVLLADRIPNHGFAITTREYHQQLLFPSEVIVARRRRDDHGEA